MSPQTASSDWDFFIAYAGPDEATARQLHDELLKRRSRAFLATQSMKPGDDWDTTLATAQRASRISVILASAHTADAPYQREEIANAIQLSRDTTHRVVPVYLDDKTEASPPYGLRRKNAIRLHSTASLDECVTKLLQLLSTDPTSEETADTAADIGMPGTRPTRVTGRRVLLIGTSVFLLLVALLAYCWWTGEEPSGYRISAGSDGIGFANATLLDIVSGLSSRPDFICPTDFLRRRGRVTIASADDGSLRRVAIRGGFICDPCYPEQALTRFQQQFPMCVSVEGAESGRVSIRLNPEGVEPWTDAEGQQWQLCKVRADNRQ